MAIIVSLLKCFNVSTLNKYFNRCWTIINSRAYNKILKIIIIHICLSNFMNAMKAKLLKTSRKHFSFTMHVLGLLASCTNIKDMRQILYDFFMVLKSRLVTASMTESHNRIVSSVNSFDTYYLQKLLPDIAEDYVDFINSSEENVVVDQAEEDHLVLTSKSYMKTFSNQINDSTKKYIILAKSPVNPSLIENDKQNTTFAGYFLKYYVIIAPLWSSLKLGNLIRFKNSINNTPTSSLIQLDIAKTE